MRSNHIRVINNRAGLPSDAIIDMCRDRRGFIWIATSEGLCRYDGYQVKVYAPLMVDGVAIKNGLLKRFV